MPRRYYRSYKKNYVPKQKWAPFMNDLVPAVFDIAAQQISGNFVSLVTNSTEAATPTPTILKVKHLKVSLDFYINSTTIRNGFMTILFVPQGYNITAGICNTHPEWVMSWRNVPNDIAAGNHSFMLTTKLSRNLNSGDKIVAYFNFYNDGSSPVPVHVSGKFSGVVRNN